MTSAQKSTLATLIGLAKQYRKGDAYETKGFKPYYKNDTTGLSFYKFIATFGITGDMLKPHLDPRGCFSAHLAAPVVEVRKTVQPVVVAKAKPVINAKPVIAARPSKTIYIPDANVAALLKLGVENIGDLNLSDLAAYVKSGAIRKA